MQPEIVVLTEKKLIGRRMKMSLQENKTAELWRSFMPERKKITRNLTKDLISMQVYTEPLTPDTINQVFEKWAAVEVADLTEIPEGMETFVLEGGLYAKFHYKGLSTDSSIFMYIFGTWLPQSDYILDNRPHFEVLGEKYKNGSPDSEEEIWIPIKEKAIG